MEPLFGNSSQTSDAVNKDFVTAFYRKNFYQSFYQSVVYSVKQGDTLSGIINSYYNVAPGSRDYQYALAHVLHNNQNIKDPNVIRPKQIIHLAPMTPQNGPAICTASDGGVIQPTYNPVNSLMGHYNASFMKYVPTDPVEQDAFFALAWFLAKYDYFALPAGAALNTMGGILGKQNNELIARINVHFDARQKGKLSKTQFNNRRRQLLREYAKRVGPLEKVLFYPEKSAQQAMWINKNNALPANANMVKYAQRLNTLSKVASHSGIILTGVGAAVGIHNMCNANTRQEKNEILVETAMGTIASVASGVILSTLLISNPVGWGMMLVLGTGAAIGSYASGKGARYLYTLSGTKVDIASASRIETLCR